MNFRVFGTSTVDLAALSFLLAEHSRSNLSFAFLHGQNHKSLFSDDTARKNQANPSTFLITTNLIRFIFCSILHFFV